MSLRSDHGDGRFATYEELGREGLFLPQGIVLGRALQFPRRRVQAIRQHDGTLSVESFHGVAIDPQTCRRGPLLYFGGDQGQEHVAVIAPTRSGKTTGVIIPNCSHYQGSLVVVDPKGELTQLTARYREEHLGHKVFVLDPERISGHPPTGINLLSLIDPRNPLPWCETLANIILPIQFDKEPYWSQEGQHILTAYLGFIVTSPDIASKARNMGLLREYIMMSAEARERVVGAMRNSEHDFVRRGANTLDDLANADGQRSGVAGSLRTATNFLEDPRVVQALSSGECDFRRLKSDFMSVYIVMSQSLLRRSPTFARLIVECILAIFEEDKKPAAISPVLLVDEFSNLGKMDVLARCLSVAGGFGLRVAIVAQDLGQLEKLYERPGRGSIMDNCTTKVWIAPSGDTITPHLEKTLGDTTYTIRSRQKKPSKGLSQNSAIKTFGHFVNSFGEPKTAESYGEYMNFIDPLGRLFSSGIDESTQAFKRPLLTASELNNLPRDITIITRAKGRPIFAGRVQSYHDREFAHLYER